MTSCRELLYLARYSQKKGLKLGSITELGAFDGTYLSFYYGTSISLCLSGGKGTLRAAETKAGEVRI
jgi:hypothetical protein